MADLRFWLPVLREGQELCLRPYPEVRLKEREYLLKAALAGDSYVVDPGIPHNYPSQVLRWMVSWSYCMALTEGMEGFAKTLRLGNGYWGLFVKIRGPLPFRSPNFFDQVFAWLKVVRKQERRGKVVLMREYLRKNPEATEILSRDSIPQMRELAGKVTPAELITFADNFVIKPRLARRISREILGEFRASHGRAPHTLRELDLSKVPLELQDRVLTQLKRRTVSSRLEYAKKEGLL